MKIQKNQIIDAEVSGIQPYGAFVKIEDGRKGLIFIEDLSVVRIKQKKTGWRL